MRNRKRNPDGTRLPYIGVDRAEMGDGVKALSQLRVPNWIVSRKARMSALLKKRHKMMKEAERDGTSLLS